MSDLLDKKDMLILDYAIDFMIPLSMLFDEESNVELNKPALRLTKTEVNERLIKLCSEGLIRFEYFAEFRSFRYGVTEKGRQLWEAAFKVNWELYLENDSELIGPHLTKIHLQSHRRELIEETLTQWEIDFSPNEVKRVEQKWFAESSYHSFPHSYIFIKLIEHKEEHHYYYQHPSYRLSWTDINYPN